MDHHHLLYFLRALRQEKCPLWKHILCPNNSVEMVVSFVQPVPKLVQLGSPWGSMLQSCIEINVLDYTENVYFVPSFKSFLNWWPSFLKQGKRSSDPEWMGDRLGIQVAVDNLLYHRDHHLVAGLTLGGRTGRRPQSWTSKFGRSFIFEWAFFSPEYRGLWLTRQTLSLSRLKASVPSELEAFFIFLQKSDFEECDISDSQT